jgi:hypothetical protein
MEVLMINIIYGKKGTGKTKIIIDNANSTVGKAMGHIIFITDTKRYMYDLKRVIRFIDTCDFNIIGEEALCGFVKGAMATDHDNEYLFIDGAARIAGKEVSSMQQFYDMLDKLSNEWGIKIFLTVSCDKELLPDFVSKYIA